MGTIQTIRERLAQKQVELKNNGKPSGFFSILNLSVTGGINILLAKWYLRKCTALGKLISVNQKPLIINHGIINSGDEVRIWSNIQQTKIFVDQGGTLTAGKNSRINGVHISVSLQFQIGDHVRSATYCISTDNDYHTLEGHFSNEATKKLIIIEDDVWITMSCMSMKGARRGRGPVIAAGTVVTRDAAPYTVVG